MDSFRFRRPSPAMVVALVALFVALGGTSYGVATGSIGSRQIKNNSIRSKDIRNNNVRGKDIRTGTIRSSDVGNGSLTGADVADDSLTGADILESSLGEVPNADHANRADRAANSDALGGTPASDFVSGVHRVVVNTSPASSTSPQNATATCPQGEKVLGGSVDVSGGKEGTSPNMYSHITTELSLSDNAASAEAYEIAPGFADTWFIFVDAVCAKTG
jgi:hypothetical protein